jgi:hypothetical protein
MRRFGLLLTLALSLSVFGNAAAKPHVVSFGKWMPVKLFVGPTEDKTVPIQVRALYVDTKLKEFTTGETHDVTDRIFVVRRAFRVNDSLPTDEKKLPKWMWQKGGWLLVDRATGRVSQVVLPDFDPYYSEVAWYRDYAAYCGISENADKVFADVIEIGRKKPLLRKQLGVASNGDAPDSECSVPQWDRQPPKVTFFPKSAAKFAFTLPDRSIDLAPGNDEESDNK